MRALFLALLASTAIGADGNRLAYLDDDSPFWPTAKSPKFITPQWIGEEGVEAAVILSIDDLREPEKYEAYIRPVLERLKKIDGHAPFSIFCCKFDPAHPQFQTWLKEGVSLEVHTVDHPCPCLGKMDFAAASRTTHDCVDLLARIPGNKPVAFRMPCCDSMNSSSPRFFAEILSGKSAEGRWLSASSSVSMIFTDGENRARFAKYQPQEHRPPVKVTFDRYSGDIADYPYPYMVGKKCIEFPFVVPSDWQGYNALGAKNPQMLADWKAALDTTVTAKGTMTLVLHPHGWSDPAQLVEFVDYAVAQYGKRVKFLSIREAMERIEKNAFGGQPPRADDGDDNEVRMLDLNSDGLMDVVAKRTRLWNPELKKWIECETPTYVRWARFGIIRGALCLHIATNAWEWQSETWVPAPELLKGLPEPVTQGLQGSIRYLRLLDFDSDGRSEFIVTTPWKNHIFEWSQPERRWVEAGFQLPDGISPFQVGPELHLLQYWDNGLRFVDLNGDGFLDIFQSNEHGYAIHLWAGKIRNDLGWTRGWSHKVAVSPAAMPPFTNDTILPFVKDGKNYGAWFHKDHVVWQNEDTAKLEAHVSRISFKDLIAVPIPPIKSPAESQKCFIPRPGFTVELVAAEPLVESPVAFEWDAHGRLWVVEMRDYPLGMDGKGEPGGRIKILTDEDGDGRYDKATIFADGLQFPTGVFPCYDGAIVAAAPDILFLSDNDDTNDNVAPADVKYPMFTGFTPGNQQHRMNGFEWGLDGWLYGANGDSGGTIRIVDTSRSPSVIKESPVVKISGRDFRFHPSGDRIEPESGQTQYGRRRDDWGNWFGNNNPTWLWHYTIEDRYLRRNPQLAVKSVRRVTNGDTRVFPAYKLADAPTRLNQPQTLGNVTSANSPTPYRDELFGPDFATSVFISEPMYNIVHREVFVPDGATFTSRRADDEKEREFLASTDLWFRPTMLKTGPDGALYIADMHRFVLEHPEWIAPETQSRMDLRAGANTGRIWRVFPTGKKPRKIPSLENLDDKELATALDSPSGWQRDTVQRLLIQNQSAGEAAKTAAPILRRHLRAAKNPKVRVQAIATLVTLDAFTPDDLRTTLRDAHPQVRVQALRAAEKLTQVVPSVLDAMTLCADDPEFIVRRQLALSLGAFRDDDANTGDEVGSTLSRLAERDGDNEQMRVAIMSSLRPEDALFKSLNTAPAAIAKVPELRKPTTPDRAKVIATYASVPKLNGDAARGQQLFKAQCALCHRLKGEGIEVGPDLAMTATKPDDWMLTAIFDPNAAVEPRYAAHLVKLKAGGELTGIIASETANNITLRLPGGTEQAVLRSDFAAVKPLGKSLMPEGIEAALKPQDVADVLAWLRSR